MEGKYLILVKETGQKGNILCCSLSIMIVKFVQDEP
jgi:hypothetical protein